MFNLNFDRPGRGIDPDAPPKTGFALFLDIIYREFWAMMGLNLLFVLYCLPVVTIGASFAAMNQILVRMIRDKPVDVIPDFRLAFRENFKNATVIWVIQVVIVLILLVNYQFYREYNSAMLTVTFAMGGFLGFVNLYLMPLLVSVDLKLKHVLKNSVLLVFANLKFTILAGLICFFTHAISLWYFHYAIFINIFFGWTFLTYIVCFLCYLGIEKYCYTTEDEN